MALGLHPLSQGLEMNDRKQTCFFQVHKCVESSLLLFLIFKLLCRQTSLLPPIALHVKQGLFQCFPMWLYSTLIALGKMIFFLKSLYLSTPLDSNV